MLESNILQVYRRSALRVLVVGGGNWATVVAKISAENACRSKLFEDKVKMWVFDEPWEGSPLARVINERHENPKYLPGVPLPANLEANSDLLASAEEADLLVFCIPHQFMPGTVAQLKGHVRRDAHAVSLVKGLLIEKGQPVRGSTLVERELAIPCVAMSGANVANDIAKGSFAETTLGYDEKDIVTAKIWQQLFDQASFKVNAVPDIAGVEVCGAIKNVVALAAGFCDGLGYGTNTKAAVIRVGVDEMRKFASRWFRGVVIDTFFDSAGYADVITTCFGGRNVRCAKEFVCRGGKDKWDVIEHDLLKGQKMQGHLTCLEVYEVISAAGAMEDFPLFTTVWKIAFDGMHPSKLLDFLTIDEPRKFFAHAS